MKFGLLTAHFAALMFIEQKPGYFYYLKIFFANPYDFSYKFYMKRKILIKT